MSVDFAKIESNVDEEKLNAVSGGAWVENVFIHHEVNDCGLENIRSIVDMDPTGNTTGNASDQYKAMVDDGSGNLTAVPISQGQFDQILNDQCQQDASNVYGVAG